MRLRDRISVGFGIATIGTAVFAIGGAERWAQAAVAVLAAGALAPQVVSRRALKRWSPLVALIAIAIVLTAIQLIPLPDGLLERLQPTGEALREQGAALVGVTPWHSLTLDAPATLCALCFYVTLLAVALLALRLSTSERGRYRVQATVAAVCGLTALVVGIHEVLGATRLYGVYELEQAHPAILGPLLNENHLGCLLALGATVSVGLGMYRRQSSNARAVWMVNAAACATGALASHSRGAAVALITGVFVTVGARMGQRFFTAGSARRSFRTSTLPIAVVAASATVVILYAAAAGVSDRFSKTTFGEVSRPKSRFEAWRDSTTLIEESPWTGIGRGALESSFTRVHPPSSFATYAYVENEYLQAVVDWGIPGALALGVAAAWLLWIAVRRWRDGALAAGALGGLCAVMAQSNFDFGVELLGVAIPITAIAATAVYGALEEPPRRRLLALRGLRVAHIMALLAAAALLFSTATKTLLEDHDDLLASENVTLNDIKPTLQRHPLDYYGYALASQVLARAGDKQAIHLLNHALVLHPTHSGLHLMAARLLAADGHLDQATVEYAAALRGTLDPSTILAEVVKALPPALAAMAIPSKADFFKTRDVVAALNHLGHADVAILVLVKTLQEAYSVGNCELLYLMALDEKDLKATTVANQLCRQYQPNRAIRARLAYLLLRNDQPAGVLQLLKDVEDWDGRIDEKADAWIATCEAQEALTHWNDATRCLHRLQAAGILDRHRAMDVTRRLDQVEKERIAADQGSASAPPPSSQVDQPARP